MVRQRIANPLFPGSIPGAASKPASAQVASAGSVSPGSVSPGSLIRCDASHDAGASEHAHGLVRARLARVHDMASALPSFQRGATRLACGMRGPRRGSLRVEPRDPCSSRACSCVSTGLAPACTPASRWVWRQAWSRRKLRWFVQPSCSRDRPALVACHRFQAIRTKLRSPRHGRRGRSWRASRCRCRWWVLSCCGQPCRCRPPPSRASRGERRWRCAPPPAPW